MRVKRIGEDTTMHYNMTHSREIEPGEYVIFEEPEWWRATMESILELAWTYQDIMGFTVYPMQDSLDGTPLLMLHSPNWGYRVVTTRD